MSVIYLDQYVDIYGDTFGVARLELVVPSLGPDRTVATRRADRSIVNVGADRSVTYRRADRTIDSLGPDRSISTRVRSS